MSWAAWRWLGAGVLLACAAATVNASELHGQLQILSGGKPLRGNEASEAVVYFRPEASFPAPAAMPAQQLSTRRKSFIPRVLPITVGTEVSFPNFDPILHNAFSTSAGNTFDTGSYTTGEGSRHTFQQPGLVKVYCNVHHSMSAHILVLDTPWFTRPDAQGRFRLQGLPPGRGQLAVFHDRTPAWEQTVEVSGENAEQVISLELTRRKVPPHMNKFGKPYGREGGRGY